MNAVYNQDYYETYDHGMGYANRHYIEFFSNIADRIIADFKPETVLDVGCAWGYLVSALRGRGVLAFGIDASEFAISKAANDIKPYCAICSLTEPLPDNFPQRFDLVTSIEVLEHLYEEDCLLAIEGLCRLTDRIIFSSSPDDITDKTHLNVQQPEYWIKQFARCGFFNDVNYTPSYISKAALVLYKTDNYIKIAEDYERCRRLLTYDALKLAAMEQDQKSECVIYIDTGQGFGESEKVIFPLQSGRFSYAVNLPQGTKAIRFDPAEGRAVILRNLDVTGNCGLIESISGVSILKSTDPQLIIDIENKGVTALLLTGEIVCFDMPQFPILEEIDKTYMALKSTIAENKALGGVIAGKEREIEELQTQRDETIADKDKVIAEKDDELDNLVRECDKLQSESNYLKNTNKQLQKEYDDVLNKLNDELTTTGRLNAEKEEMHAKANEMANVICQRDAQIDSLYASNSWKVTAPLRGVVTGVRKSVKNLKDGCILFKKGIVSLKNNGFGATLNKISERKRRIIETETHMLTNKPVDERRIVYDSQYQNNEVFDSVTPDVKALAFYLPQFHRIPENDHWWGEGFTEWSKTKKCTPRFYGHYQPRVPHRDIGYYDLSDVNTLKKQCKLAREHGIYGFCFYYYWFSGKRLLEKPVDMLLEHKEININFALCWANENWTRRWDGQNSEILMKQNYEDSDSERFINDIAPYINDSRYIRIKGKPVILVYDPGAIPNIQKTFNTWRVTARKIGIGEILIWTCQTCNNTAEILKITSYVDAEVQFPPHNTWHSFLGVRDIDVNGKEAFIYNYQKLVRYLTDSSAEYKNSIPLYRTCMLGWDNAARRENAWTTFCYFSLNSYYEWLTDCIQFTRRNFYEDERFVFINAWNEWAEGTYLEPDELYGYASINITTRALLGYPFYDTARILTNRGNVLKKYDDTGKTPRIAVHVHLFYMECMDSVINNLNAIPYRFDCYISTDTGNKMTFIKKRFESECRAENIYIDVIHNRGRDAAPFLIQMRDRYYLYDFICHIHTKKTASSNYGDLWREYLYFNLLGCKENVKCLLDLFLSDDKLGLIFPETYPPLFTQAEWGGNKPECDALFTRLGLENNLPIDNPVFPVGNMFWARSEAIETIFKANLNISDFPAELGQVNATMAHVIERSWCYIAKAGGYGYIKTLNYCGFSFCASNKRRISFFAHYDKNQIISESDMRYIKNVSACSKELIFISNSPLSADETGKIKPYASKIIIRENQGFDFGAWKEGLITYGFENLIKGTSKNPLNFQSFPYL